MFLVCKSVNVGKRREVLSPGVGRARLLVVEGQPIIGGQAVADFWCLNRHFVLQASDHCDGRIVRAKDHDVVVNLSYGETFLVVDSTATSKTHGLPELEESAHLLKDDNIISSPMDGMFYLSASPKSPPFVNIGDEIVPGQTLGLIEVMKCFYPLKYQGNKASKITGVVIKNATPVTCGTRLYTIT